MMADLFEIGLEVDTAPLKRGTNELGRFSKAGKSAGAQALQTTRDIRAATAAFTSFFAVAKGIGVITNFEDAMLGLNSTLRATTQDMAALEAQARLLGASSTFSATEAANAQRFLAQAGFDTLEVLQATPTALKLAKAGTLDLASAADIASNVLGGMRLEVDQFNRVADVMAETAASSNTNIEQLGSALSYVAPVAAGAGISLELTSAAIGKLSDNGLQATRAGTGLLGIIRQLSKPSNEAEAALSAYNITLEDVSIETNGLVPVLEKVQAAGLSVADMFKVFGSEAQPAAAILLENVNNLRDFEAQLGSAEGAAQEMADTMSSGLSSSFKSFNSQVSESVLQLGDSGLSGALQDVTDSAAGVLSVYNGMLDEFAEANDLTEEQAAHLQDMADSLRITATTATAAAGAYATYTAGAWLARTATIALTASMTANPIGLAVIAAGALGGLMYSLSEDTDKAAESVDNLRIQVVGLQDAYKGLSQASLESELERLLRISDGLKANLASEENSVIESITGELTRDMLSNVADQIDEVEASLARYQSTNNKSKAADQMSALAYEYKLYQDAVTSGEKATSLNIAKQYQLYQTLRTDAINDAVTESDAIDWATMFEGATPSFVDALASGDFSQLGNSIGDIVGGVVSSKLGAGLGSSIAGGLAGAAVGYAISNLTSKYESTGSTSNLSVSGSSLSGFNEESFKKSGLFGSSRKTEVDNYTSSEISAISNTVTGAQASIVNLLSNMGSSIAVGVDDFKTNVSASDPAAAVEEITNEFISANVAYIEDFQELNQTALSALSDLSETVSSVTDSFSISSGSSLENAFSSYISNQAANLSNYYSTTLPNQLRSQQAALQGEINNILNSASSYETSGRDNQNTRLKYQLKARIKDLETDIASVEGQIVESLSRVGSSLANATATFTTGVEKSLASIYNINTDDVPQLLSELVSNYEQGFFTASEQAARAVSNAESALSDFSSLGINATTSLDEFQAKFEAFTKSSGFNPTTYAQWLAASDAMLTLNSAVEANADLVEESASALEDVNKRILAAQDNDEALLAIERAEELAAAESDLVKARLNELYAIEDAISSTEVFDTITNFVEELMGLSADGTQSLASARTAYIEALNLAATGDEDAISEVSGLAQTFLDLFADQASTSSEVANNRATVISQLQAATTGTTIPAFANGGQHSGGWAMIGEQGPELVNMGPSAVYSNSDSKKMLDNSDTIGAINNMSNYLGGALRVIAKNSKTMTDYIELWDNEGMPINSETPINVEVV